MKAHITTDTGSPWAAARIELDGKDISAATQEVLINLGWTPPKEDQ